MKIVQLYSILDTNLSLCPDFLDLLIKFSDVFIQMGTEFIDVGISLGQGLVYSIPDIGDTGVQSLKKNKNMVV